MQNAVPEALAAPRQFASRAVGARLALPWHWTHVALVALIVFVGAAASWQAIEDSPTIDEPVYVTAGLTILTRDDARLNPQHPPLAKVLAALPVLAAGPTLPYGPHWRNHKGRLYSQVFDVQARRDGKLRRITVLSRIVPVLELLATVLLIFLLASRLAGSAGGLFAAALWGLNPFVLGIGHFDGIDLPFTLATLAAVLALARWLELRSTSRAVQLGVACGAALLVRYTGPLVLVVAFATVALAARRAWPPLIVGAVAVAVVWLFYAVADPSYTFSHLNVLPQRYMDGIGALAAAHAGPQDAYLLGHHWKGTRWWFWPANALIKLPVTVLAAFVLTPFFLRRVPEPARRRVYAALIPSAVVLAIFTVATPDDRGLRYMLPVVALLTAAVAPVVLARRLLAIVLVAGTAAFAIASLPHSLAWTAPPFTPGYRYATDANLDWGQDARDLQRWARGKHAWIACYSPRGSGCLAGIPDGRGLSKHENPAKVHGWVAISSTLLNLDDWHPWLRRYRPTGTIDGTILLYRIPPGGGAIAH